MNNDIYEVAEKPSKLKSIATRAIISAAALGVTGFVAVASFNGVTETPVAPTDSVAKNVEISTQDQPETQSTLEPAPADESLATEPATQMPAAPSPEPILTPLGSIGTLAAVENEDGDREDHEGFGDDDDDDHDDDEHDDDDDDHDDERDDD